MSGSATRGAKLAKKLTKTQVFKSLSDLERLTLLAAFGLPPQHVWVSKSGPDHREQLRFPDISKGGMRPIITLLERKLIQNLSAPGGDLFKMSADNTNVFQTTPDGNLMVLAILDTEYGYDTHPDWLEE